jgi:hypothetical protein
MARADVARVSRGDTVTVTSVRMRRGWSSNGMDYHRCREDDMGDRKPPGESIGSWIEAQISAAMQEGAFDNLPGAGKPFPHSGQGYDPDQWVRQLIQREGAHITPPLLSCAAKLRENSLQSIHSKMKRVSGIASRH